MKVLLDQYETNGEEELKFKHFCVSFSFSQQQRLKRDFLNGTVAHVTKIGWKTASTKL